LITNLFGLGQNLRNNFESQLSAIKDGIPWQRVVADGGAISAPKTTKAAEQIEYLAREGIEVNKAKKVIDFEAVFIAAADLNGVVEQQYRENGLESG
jgi:alkylated DNA nucleotide flippase Atl1